MGKDFPWYCLWRLLAPDRAGDVRCVPGVPRIAAPTAFHSPHEGGDGPIRRPAALSATALRHPQLCPEPIRTGALRRDDALHRRHLQPGAGAEPLGRAAGDERVPAPAGQLDACAAAVVRAPPGSVGRGDRAGPRRPCRRAGAPPEASRRDPRLLRDPHRGRGRRGGGRRRGSRGVRGARAGRHRRADPGATPGGKPRGGGAARPGAVSGRRRRGLQVREAARRAAQCGVRAGEVHSLHRAPRHRRVPGAPPRRAGLHRTGRADSRRPRLPRAGGAGGSVPASARCGRRQLPGRDRRGGRRHQPAVLLADGELRRALESGAPRAADGPHPPLRTAARPGGHRQPRRGRDP